MDQTSDDPPVSGRRPAIPALTGVRFIAALMVFLFHSGSGLARGAGLPAPVVTFLSNGYLGVSLFFILSGFIITYTYDGKLRDRAAIRSFAVARFCRLYPVYVLALLVTLPLAWQELRVRDAALVLAMVQSWTLPQSGLGYAWLMQAWTLSIELFFYLSAPILLVALATLSTARLAAVAGACAALMVALGLPSVHPNLASHVGAIVQHIPLPLCRLVEFVYGASLCKLYLAHRRALEPAGALFPIALNLALIIPILASTTSVHWAAAAMALVGVLLVQIALAHNLVSRFLATRAMVLLGGASYAFYLIAAPTREWLRFLPGESLERVVLPFAAIGVSILIYLAWEEPARRWLRPRIAKAQQTPTSLSAPAGLEREA